MKDSTETQNTGRREALIKIALGSGGMITLPILGQAAVTPAMARAAHRHPAGQDAPPPDPNWTPLFFDEHQNETVETLTELIISTTGTPGAKAALVNRFIDLLLHEEPEARKRSFIEGLAWLEGRSMELHGAPFTRLTAEQQAALLAPLAAPHGKDSNDQPGVRFFEEIKDLTIFGYYTSKIGMEQELEYAGDDYHTEYPGACTHPEHQT